MLSQSNVFVIGFVASIVVWAIKQWTAKGKNIPSAVLTIAVYVVSLVLAVVWSHVQFPSIPVYAGDPVAFASSLYGFLQAVVSIIGGYVAFAALVYQAFVKALLEKGVPMGVEKVRALIGA